MEPLPLPQDGLYSLFFSLVCCYFSQATTHLDFLQNERSYMNYSLLRFGICFYPDFCVSCLWWTSQGVLLVLPQVFSAFSKMDENIVFKHYIIFLPYNNDSFLKIHTYLSSRSFARNMIWYPIIL